MQTTLEFGRRSELSLDLSSDVLVADLARNDNNAIEDASKAIKAALENPQGLPPFCRTVVPGDRIAFVVEEGLPEAPGLIAGAVDAAMDAGIEPTNITVVQTKPHQKLTNDNVLSTIPDALRHQLQVVTHDPEDRDGLSFLAASEKAEAIYFNRQICDADVVIPIGCQRPAGSLGYLGVFGTLFPMFADIETQKRFLAPSSATSEKQRQDRHREATEAAWLLGVTLLVQVIPGNRNQLLHVLAGTAEEVGRRASTLCEAAWRFPVSRRASLIVAGIAGGREQQTWINVARTLSTVLPYVEDDGAVVVCSDLNARPGPSLRRLAGSSSLDAAEQAIRRDRTPDALPAKQLIDALRRVRVYLLSRLDEDLVENLGIAYVSEPGEVATLSSHHDSCIVLGNAQRAALSLADVA